MARTEKVNGWLVQVHHDESAFLSGDVVFRVLEKPKGARQIGLYAPDGYTEIIEHQLGGFLPELDARFDFHIPEAAIPALIAALTEHDPATERLTSKLESLLDREAGRVDKLIDTVSRPVVNNAVQS